MLAPNLDPIILLSILRQIPFAGWQCECDGENPTATAELVSGESSRAAADGTRATGEGEGRLTDNRLRFADHRFRSEQFGAAAPLETGVDRPTACGFPSTWETEIVTVIYRN